MKLKLKTLTPLFIGKGDGLLSYNWYINITNKLNNRCLETEAFILKKDLLAIFLEDLKLNNRVVKKIFNKRSNNYGNKEVLNLSDIEKNIKSLDIIEEEKKLILKKIENYKTKLKAKIYKKTKIESKQLDLFNFVEKNNEFFFYIPGSSIKGALRTYVVFKLLLELDKLLNNKFKKLVDTEIKSKLYELRKKNSKEQLKEVINDLQKNNENVILLNFLLELIESFLSGKNLSFKIGKNRNKNRKTKNLSIRERDFQEIINNNKKLYFIILEFLNKNRMKIEENYLKFLEELKNVSPIIEDFLKKYHWFFGFFKATNFIIRDSNFLNVEDFIVLEVKRKKGDKEKGGITNFILALDENKEIMLELIIKNYKKEFIDYLNKDNLTIEMGRFAGANFKSFLAFLADYYPSTQNYTCDDKKLGKIKIII